MSERPEIRRLDSTTVDRIAAGEIVERPASVVKELVENSLDADASRIVVEVDAGGTDRVRVSDDGIGMTRTGAKTAIERHTTSKIRDIEDVESGVATLGFRGEALHTIGAVSQMTVTTKPREEMGAGTKLTVVGGDVESVEPAGCPEGTTVEVTNLFYNTPARRKYLKTQPTEFDHVNAVVTQYALANPAVATSLEHDGREVFATTGQGDLRSTILSVYGREVATAMLSLDDAPLADGPLDGLGGAVSDPETTRSSATYVSTYVNGRYVRSKAVRDALLSAYDTRIAPDRYPFAVLSLSVPGDAVDVNVHPRKMEVKYNKSEAVKRQVEAAVEDTLREEGILRSSAPRGRSAPDQTTIEPSSTADRSDDSPPGESDARSTADTEPRPSQDTKPSNAGGDRSTDGTDGSDRSRSQSGGLDEPDKPDGPNGTDGSRSPSTTSSGSGSTSPSESTSAGSPSRASPDSSERSPETSESTPSDSHQSGSTVDRGPDTQTTLQGGDATSSAAYDTIPDLRVLGQAHDTYIVAEADDGLILIDQHAADERVNYERLREAFDEGATTQALVEPVRLELTAREATLFDEYREALAQLGFTAACEGRTATVTTVPAVVDDALDPALLRELLNAFVDGDPADTVEATADALLADLACHPSIKANTSLTEGSIVELLDALDDCANPYACPHGRPTVISLDATEIADRFERDYPGHTGRREE